jgi:cytochrome b pre-mRNA-processing protein 3
MKLLDLFNAKGFDETARKIYAKIVAQARQPGFYTFCGVPDTADGRFDMILLHAFLLLRRLKRDHARTADLGQAVFDLMFADMDQNLREMGVGDLAVGKRVKGMAAAFYGRIAAYEAGLEDNDGKTLEDALRHNLYRKTSPRDDQVAAIAGYVGREAKDLDDMDTKALIAGEVAFGPAPGGPEKAEQ